MDSDYWNALDKGKELRVDPNQIGISHGIGDVGEGLKANVFRGAKVVELGFMGAAKGSRSQPGGHTPESYGTRERQEMRELAKVNDIEISTHASPNIGYASGYQEGAFRDETRQFVLHEVKRAIDFASDVTQGGPVVMHLGEFPRPLYNLEKTEEGKPRFLAFPEEEKKAPLYVVDDRTGKLEAIRRDTEVTVPIPAKEGADPWENPLRNEKGLIKFETKKISDFEKQAYEEGKDPVKFIFEKFIHREVEMAKGEERRFTSIAKGIEEEYREIERRISVLEEQRKKDPDRARIEAINTAKGMKIQPSEDSPEFEQFIKDPYSYATIKIKDFSIIDEYQFFYGNYLGNHYFVLLLPNLFSYELFEYGIRYGQIKDEMTDFEDYYGRKDYASNSVGGYYAVRLAVLEHLKRIKRQASIFIIRYETEEYWANLGVWVCETASRKAMDNKYISFYSRENALDFMRNFIFNKMKQDVGDVFKRSKLLNYVREQKNLFDFYR